MARIDNKKNFRGTIGNVVFRTLDGKQIVQSKAARRKQTKATKISGSEFRQCSTWAKQLRLGLGSFLVGLNDSYMYRRFAGAFYKALQTNNQLPKGERNPFNSTMGSLAGFEFNNHSPFTTYFTPPITAVLNNERKLVFTIPAFTTQTELQFPENVHKAELVLYAYSTNLGDNATIAEDYTIIPFDQNSPSQNETTWTSLPLPEGSFTLVCAKIMYYRMNTFSVKNYVNTLKLNPAVIVATFGDNG
ncbi:hypothetical protein [Flavobacterium sp.]|uniref:hypothetical protein n=1 Tax=Flavobacterium sp. TaxID=239 RepID=UPI00248858F2|nr:hypothetical protein [Flavobacterium sp.]MDI1317080.1 hypothetical protein [Flavobacterium sp.]